MENDHVRAHTIRTRWTRDDVDDDAARHCDGHRPGDSDDYGALACMYVRRRRWTAHKEETRRGGKKASGAFKNKHHANCLLNSVVCLSFRVHLVICYLSAGC